MITSAAKIARQLPDTVNYQKRLDESQTRIKFEYIMLIINTKITCVRKNQTLTC